MNSVFVFIARLKKKVNLSGKKTYEFTSNLPEFFRQNPPGSLENPLLAPMLCAAVASKWLRPIDSRFVIRKLVGWTHLVFLGLIYITYLYGGEIIQFLSTMQDIQVCVCDTFLFSKILRIQPNVV